MSTEPASRAMSFEEAFDRLLGHEGGYTRGAGDPGGETNWGISKRAYPTLNIRKLTREQAQAIYRRDFWARIGADRLPGAVAFQVFDYAVNAGIEVAVRHLQRAVGVVDDGHWGPISAAAARQASASDIVLRLNAERLDYLTRLPNWPTASRGWARRIAQNLRYGAVDA